MIKEMKGFEATIEYVKEHKVYREFVSFVYSDSIVIDVTDYCNGVNAVYKVDQAFTPLEILEMIYGTSIKVIDMDTFLLEDTLLYY